MKKIISLVWRPSDARYADDLVMTIVRLKSIIFGLDKDERGLRTTIRFLCAQSTIEVMMEYTDSELKDLPSTTVLPS
jgi:hypothetical protein